MWIIGRTRVTRSCRGYATSISVKDPHTHIQRTHPIPPSRIAEMSLAQADEVLMLFNPPPTPLRQTLLTEDSLYRAFGNDHERVLAFAGNLKRVRRRRR